MEFAKLRFLVVEDHGFQRWMVGNLLERLGAQYVYSAAEGAEAIAMLADREPPIDVVITDLDMPGMDGMEFIRHVGGAKHAAAMILATGMERSLVASVEAMAREYGVNLLGSIAKPVTAAKLKAIILAHAGARPAEDAVPERVFTPAQVAAALKRGEFVPFFQPKVDIRTEAVKGAEAVARWRHPDAGILRPHAFISTMEEHGLIDELTVTMLRQAAAACRGWREAGLDASVSVNLSQVSLRDVTLSERMVRLVEDNGLEPRQVIFEVTESVAAAQLGHALENLARLRMKGFGLSIDDYGTGYSSMERLASIPFTELKVDQGFVRKAATQAASRALLESSIETALRLGLVAVAEGVESAAEWDTLRALGCHLAQGYRIARPMEGGSFAAWAQARHRASA